MVIINLEMPEDRARYLLANLGVLLEYCDMASDEFAALNAIYMQLEMKLDT